MKTQIVEQLGHSDILLPSRIAEGLAANDRVKVRLSALQAAAEHARAPAGRAATLENESRAAGLEATKIQSLVGGARMTVTGQIAAPALDQLIDQIREDVETMIAAIESGAADDATAASDRLAAIKAQGLLEAADEIDPHRVVALTAVSTGGADSLHRLVMDMHKTLNRLSAQCAEDMVAGARVHGLLPDDRPIVEAFMRGLDSTRRLKFDHPGLDATAARSGSRLVIQNDIGTTDAHVIVIAIEGSVVSVTYTDVHLVRANFFVSLFDAFAADWSGLDRKRADGLGDDGIFYLVTGRYEADSAQSRDCFLEAVGAALVFLIDWNKARKVLRQWVSKGDAIRILDWAARNRVGHRGFLELGGGELVVSTIRHAAPARIGFGERLDTTLGREAAVDFLKSVLRISAEGLLEGRSNRLVRDRIEAEVARHLDRVDRTLLAIVVRQAGLARELATGIARDIEFRQRNGAVDGTALAARARRIEEKADKIAMEGRNEVARFNAAPSIQHMIDRLEETIDELEQAAFIASLVPAQLDPAVLAVLGELCAAATGGAEAAACGADAAGEVPEGRRVDAEDALAAVGRLIDFEHIADVRERAVTTVVLRGGFDVTTSLSVLELARSIERATDRLAGFAHGLRQYVLADLAS